MESRIFRALIVDDEPIARLHLRKLLGAHPEIQIVGEVSNAVDAEKLAAEADPDVIFLDVQMPTLDGFELLSRLDERIHIVFVTSFDKYALKGFEINALDYVLKPLEPSRLEITIRRLLDAPAKARAKAARVSLDDLVVVSDAEQTRTTQLKFLSCIQAEGNYSRLYTCDDCAPMLMLRSLSEWEPLLPAPPFVRIDRSLFINLTHVQKFTPISRNLADLVMTGTSEPFSIGRTAAVRLRSALRTLDRRDI